MYDEEQFATLLAFFKALANESRLKLIGALAGGPRSVSELADFVEVSEPTVSHHLSQLRALGLVEMEARGNLRIYRLNSRQLERMSRVMLSRERVADLADAPPALSQDQKILARFLDGDRLRAIPAKQKYQLIVMQWLVALFEPDRRYSEQEVNALLAQRHDDTAYWRRRLVSFGFMARESGIYWRLPQPAPAG